LSRKRIAYYISSHGFGHAARTASVLLTLCADYDLYIKTEIPGDYFQILRLPHIYIRHKGDTGCVQKNFIDIDRTETLKRFQEYTQDRGVRLRAEVDWLEENEIDLVVSDVPSSPLRAAQSAGIPGLLLANFTWHDIYSGFPEIQDFPGLLDILKEEYGCASLQILPQCHLHNTLVANQEEVGWISLKGQSIRDTLQNYLKADWGSKKLVFIYFGVFDATQVNWKALAGLEDYVFLTRDPLPTEILPPNVHVLDEQFLFPNLIASVDLVMTKAGYSTFATALTHGKPVVSCSREDFREFEAMRSYLEQHQVGRLIPTDRFFDGDWGQALEETRVLQVEGKVPLGGEKQVRSIVDRFLTG